jgi:putative SOS response-associated peptidase YedK
VKYGETHVMCGRYSLTVSPEQIRRAFPQLTLTWDPSPRWNIAPSQDVLVALNDGSKEITTAKWGLIPSWEKAPNGGRKPINARLETLAQSRLFAPLLKRRRCAIISDGFFEWATEDGKKLPYHFRLKTREPFAFAGLWDQRDGIPSCSIVTGAANELVAPLHDRMPMILRPDDLAMWMRHKELAAAEAIAMLHPFAEGLMERQRVSTLVNKPRNDVPEIFTEAPDQATVTTTLPTC